MTDSWGINFQYDLEGVGITPEQAKSIIAAIKNNDIAEPVSGGTRVSEGPDQISLSVSLRLSEPELTRALKDAAAITQQAVEVSGVPVDTLSTITATPLDGGVLDGNQIELPGDYLDSVIDRDN